MLRPSLAPRYPPTSSLSHVCPPCLQSDKPSNIIGGLALRCCALLHFTHDCDAVTPPFASLRSRSSRCCPPLLHRADLDIAACAFSAAGTQIDVCYFKNPAACGGAIGLMANSGGGFGYGNAETGVFVTPERLPEECNYVFVSPPSCLLQTETCDLLDLARCALSYADGVHVGVVLTMLRTECSGLWRW